jgi:osmoprotectant transport system permease protein
MALFGSAGPLIEWSWVASERSMILSLLVQHIELTVIAVVVGMVIAVPLGIFAWKVPIVRPPLVGFTGVLYVIPSIALLSLVAPVTGYFSVTTAEVVLVGYTLLILLRNTVAGLDSVPAEAQGMGYTQAQELMKVQLPLALPSILAGVRIATVTTIGLVTVTAFIGQGGLGQLIIQGFSEDFNTPIFVGLALSVLLAAVADALIVGLERVSLPWMRRRRAS